MSKRRVKFLCGRVTGYKLNIKRDVIAQMTCMTQFDQNLAEDLDARDQLFDKHGATARNVTEWKLDIEFFGARLRVIPRQATTDKQVTIDNDGVSLSSLHAHSFMVKKPQDEGGPSLRVTFKVDLLDATGEAHRLIHGIRKDDVDFVLELANQKDSAAAEEAARQAGLFGKPKESAEESEEEEELVEA